MNALTGVRFRLDKLLDEALHELGVPSDETPAPVANAVEKIREARDLIGLGVAPRHIKPGDPDHPAEQVKAAGR